MTTGATERAALAEELRVLMARSGVTVPEEWFEGTLAGYADLRRMAATLRVPRSAESEPAVVFDVAALLRGDVGE